MTDLEKLHLRDWLLTNHEGWQRVQQYLDMRIDEISKDCIDYALNCKETELIKASGKIEAYQELKILQSALEA